MAEVEKKKKLTKKEKIILTVLGITVVGYLGFWGYDLYKKAEQSKLRLLGKGNEKVNPAQVPAETIAKAINSKRTVPPPPPSTKTSTKNAAGSQSKVEKNEAKTENREKEKKTEWKLPKPKGSLIQVPKYSKSRYTGGLPRPSFQIFPKAPVKKEKVAERMKVITPRLRIVERKKETPKQVQQPVSTRKEKFETVVAAGMFVPAVLSQGIMAPIGYKVPVRFKVTGRAVGVGDYSFDLSSCVVLGAGKGIETGNTARIEVELVKLSCQWPDGNLHTVPVTGYVVDNLDGKLHLAANLKENESQLVLASFLQGAVIGAAEAAQKAQEVTQTTALNQNTSVSSQEIKNEHKYILWGGVAGAFSQTQKMLEQKINRLMQLKTADREPGGKVYLVFTQDVRVPESWIKGSESETEKYDFAGYERW